MYERERILSPHRSSPRPYGAYPRYIVVHCTATAQDRLWAVVSWFLNPSSRVSAHAIIGPEGRVVRMVDDADVAWHAGNWWYNMWSVGVELVHPNTHGTPYPVQQKLALGDTCVEWCVLHGIQPENIIGHYDVLPGKKTDPVDLPLEQLREYVRETIPTCE